MAFCFSVYSFAQKRGRPMRTSAFLGAVLLLSPLWAHAQAPAGGRGAQPGLEPRVVVFEARPATIRAGEPVVLIWQTENPAGVSIDQGIGTVTARGSRTVTPGGTTTYTLSMRN